jgi:thiol-disulfide isomerase/thioredoxin
MVMTGILAAAVVVVGVLAGADFLLTFAVIRRLAALEQRAGSTAAGSGSSPAIGYQVRDFRVPLVSGGEFTQADLAGHRVTVMFVSPSCEPCRQAIADLRAQPGPLPSPLYVLVAADGDDHGAAAIAADLPAEAIVGEVPISGAVTEAFGIEGFPTVVVIDDGQVRANVLRVSSLPDLVWQ